MLPLIMLLMALLARHDVLSLMPAAQGPQWKEKELFRVEQTLDPQRKKLATPGWEKKNPPSFFVSKPKVGRTGASLCSELDLGSLGVQRRGS